MRAFVFLLYLVLLPIAALAADALSGDEIRLADGRIVRLLGIEAANGAARERLQSLIAGRTLLLESGGADRYGRIAADVYLQPDGKDNRAGERIWLQGELLKAGSAFVYPAAGTEPHLADLLQLEQGARQARRGLWNDPAYADLPAAEPDAIGPGRFAFVSGKVVSAKRVKNMVYLNFGEDWRHDFAAAIAAHDLRRFAAAGIDPLAYEGKTLRVRGWVKRDFGPMITVTHPAQIEILGETPVKP